MPKHDLDTFARALFVAPSLEERGVGVDEVLFALGLVCERFFDGVWGAEPGAIEALERAAGLALPPRYRSFLAAAGGTLGPLRIVDDQRAWEFRPDRVAAALSARPAEQREAYRRAGWIPVAEIGKSLDAWHDIDGVFLLLDAASGWIFADDFDRANIVYDSIQAFVIEWGHRVLDPRGTVWIGEAAAVYEPAPEPGVVARIHQLVTDLGPERDGSWVGGMLGLYAFHDSLVIVKARPDDFSHLSRSTIEIEAFCARAELRGSCAAAELLRRARAHGLSVNAPLLR